LASYGDNDDNFTIVDEDRVLLIKTNKFCCAYKIILQSHEDDLLQQEEGVLYIGIDGNLESEAGPSEYSKNILEEGK